VLGRSARERETRPAVEKERGGEVGRCGLAGPEEKRERVAGLGQNGKRGREEGLGFVCFFFFQTFSNF
jgi:hypothetical protein